MVLNLLLVFITSVSIGDTLVNKGFYNKGIVEYERALFYDKGDSLDLFDRIAGAYYREGNYPQALRYYSKVYAVSNDSSLRFQIYRSLYKNGQYSVLNSILSAPRNEKDSFLLALSLEKTGYYGKSANILKSLNYNVRFKNPYFNKYISYLIPGSGQILAGHIKDGIVAIIINGAFAYYGYTLFKNKEYMTMVLTVPVFLRFYLGNATAAWNFTLDENNRMLDRVETQASFSF